MSTTDLRQKLHRFIDHADDKKIKAIYTIMEKDIVAHSVWDDDAFIDELEKRVNEVESGTGKSYTWKEVQSNAARALKAVKKR